MAVLMVSVMVGGQYLLTTTVEEKSSRVVEVLLSALSPMQLMTGKIAGQLGVGLVILLIYGSIGGGALILFGLADLLGFMSLLYMVLFFLIAYVTVGALMAAIGSSVNDMREAQSLQGPVMISLVIPYMLWFPISRDPNSVFATVISFLPPVSPFVMMLRITSTEPPPTWQVLLSILVGLVGVYVIAVWAAAKIFRIGLLMFGKPPNLRDADPLGSNGLERGFPAPELDFAERASPPTFSRRWSPASIPTWSSTGSVYHVQTEDRGAVEPGHREPGLHGRRDRHLAQDAPTPTCWLRGDADRRAKTIQTRMEVQHRDLMREMLERSLLHRTS